MTYPVMRTRYSGFTLIELSIVLVIIGLIVGSVLVGRDLISGAEVRAQIKQIEDYKIAVNTFKLKYNYLPGDIPNPEALELGLVQPNIGGDLWRPGSDGNGVIHGSLVFSRGAGQTHSEHSLFWWDLADTNLIDYKPTEVWNATYIDRILPPARIGNGNHIYAWSGGIGTIYPNTANNGKNYFGIAWFPTPVPTWGACVDGSDVGMTVRQAYNMDSKMDDGMPHTGRVIAFYTYCQGDAYVRYAGGKGGGVGPTDNSASAATVNSCMDNSNGVTTAGQNGVAQHYSLGAGTAPDSPNCALSFQF